MIHIFNAAIVLLVVLIGYWWANQGLFSAMLHLLCVIGAGAVAIGVYEPLAVGLLIRGTWFDEYAWGVSLVSVFIICLLVFRVISDKVVRANITVPQWANYAFGFPLGAVAGVLSIGVLMIGAGMIQSHRELMGYIGYGRSQRTGQVEYLGPTMWVPIHRWTSSFYEYLSVGSLHPTFNGTPLRQANPELYTLASLMRDSFGNGEGKLSLSADAARVESVVYDPDSHRHAVAMVFNAAARDFGEQLTLSASQIRLICRRSNDASVAPVVVHPDAWSQRTRESGEQMLRFRFDSIAHYITSVPGRERTEVLIEFPVPREATPTHIQIRGTRYRLPGRTQVDPGTLMDDLDFGFSDDNVVLGTGPNIQEFVEVSNSIRPITASTNQPTGRLELQDNLIAGGEHVFASRGERPSRALMIRGIYEPPGTRVVQVHIQPGQPHNIFNRRIQQHMDEGAKLMLVDESGRAYSPIGYIHERTMGQVAIKVDTLRFLPTSSYFPVLPEGGREKLRILFAVTEGVRLKGFMLGNMTMGTFDLEVSGGVQR